MTGAHPACDDCAQESVTFLRYCGKHLCAEHLRRFVDRRIAKEVRRQGGFPNDVRVAVALSGGKDSTVALAAMHTLLEKRPDTELVAITVDEGIAGYRPDGLAAASDLCRRLGVEHVIRRTQDLAGHTIDQIQAARPDRAPCSFCGVFRRRLLNDAARQTGADLLVTGHNLDDVAQSVLMNVAGGEIARLARLGPHLTAQPGLIPRRMPLRTIPEKEVYLYAMVSGLTWHDQECPYAAQGQRTLYRDILARMEDARPGTRHAMLKTLDTLRPLLGDLAQTGPVGSCSDCAQPTSGSRCQACRLADEARGLVARA
jgi:uncharacterized protein (TIGR00269 family)